MTPRGAVALVSLLAVTASPAPVSAYRVLSELPELAGDSEVVWTPAQLTYSIQADAAHGVSLASVLRVAEPAFATWSAPDCISELAFAYDGGNVSTAAPDDRRNSIEWLRVLWAERGFSPDVMASTDLLYERGPEGDWRIVEADIYFNAVDYSWSAEAGEPDTNRRSIRAVLTHEAGHVVGLLHPCELGAADGAPACDEASGAEHPIMYPLYLGPTHYALSSDDEAGVCALYGCGRAGCGTGMGCVAGECRAACGSEVCGRDEVCDGTQCQPLCGGSICPPSRACETTDDCGDGYECRTGFCIPRGAQPGDPCAADADCASGVCAEGGYCAIACGAESCPAGYTCAPDVDRLLCQPEQGVFGDVCSSATGCATGLCLSPTSDPTRSTCTRGCAAESAECPLGYACEPVEGRQVCVPASGGCNASAARAAEAPASALLFCFALAVYRRRSRS